MITITTLRKLALSLPETEEAPHFEKISFRVQKKIFATYDSKLKRATIKLSEADQDVFARMSKGAIFPVGNKWGRQGWTHVELKSVNKVLFTDALLTSYCEVAPKTLVALIRKRIED
jgi:predicted DNA-binding protein (MmcQ/YjbR family)